MLKSKRTGDAWNLNNFSVAIFELGYRKLKSHFYHSPFLAVIGSAVWPEILHFMGQMLSLTVPY